MELFNADYYSLSEAHDSEIYSNFLDTANAISAMKINTVKDDIKNLQDQINAIKYELEKMKRPYHCKSLL